VWLDRLLPQTIKTVSGSRALGPFPSLTRIHVILGSRLRLSLLRSAYEPDEIADLGEHEVCFSLLPHPGDWRQAGVARSASGFNQPLLAQKVNETVTTKAKLLGWKPEFLHSTSVLMTGLKSPKNGLGVILRLVESSGFPSEAVVQGLSEKLGVWETNVLEDKLKKIPVISGCVHLTFSPWEVKTILVD
jgi:alpha-mannosidase